MILAPEGHRLWWLAVAAHLWRAGIVILLLWAIERLLLRRAPARYRSLLWSLALAALCLPPAVAGGWLEALLRISGLAAGAAGAVSVAGLHSVLRLRALEPDAPAAATSLWLVPTVLWLAGMALLGTRLLRARREAAAVGSFAEPVRGERLAAAARRAGVDPDRVALSATPCMPHARGLLRPRIVVPVELLRHLNTEEMAAVLSHEDAHLRRRDSLRQVVALPVGIVFWFFPLTWLVLGRLYAAAELACDEAVLARGFEHRVYARALARTLRLGLGWPAWSPALAGAAGADVRSRLGNLRRAGKERRMKRHSLAIGCALTVLVASLAVAAPGPSSGQRRQTRESVLTRYPVLKQLRAVDRAVDLEMTGTLTAAFERLAALGGFEVDTSALPADATVTVAARNSTVGEVLAILADGHAIEYTVTGPRRLVVTPIRGPVGVLRERGSQQGPPYPVGGTIQAPEKTHHVSPEYPELARRAGLEGVVILEATVDPTGDVTDVEVLRGLGLGLDEAAIAAVQQWRYTPTLYRGEPVEVLLTVTVRFELPDEQSRD